jgi:hypothetical protein
MQTVLKFGFIVVIILIAGGATRNRSGIVIDSLEQPS